MATASQVREMFRQFGVPLDFHSSGATEDPNARVSRLVAGLNSGSLTWDRLRESVTRLAQVGQGSDFAGMEDRLRQVFNEHDVPMGFHSSGAGEAPNARIARLAREITSGKRTFDSVVESVRRLAVVAPRPPGGGEGGGAPPEKKGPSFFEQAKLLFPFIPDSLIKVYAEKWEEFGSRDLALQAMRQDPRYDKHFPGIKREDGTLRLTEQEYLSTVESYKRQLGQFGVPVGSVLNQGKIAQLITGEVSAQEFGQRISQAYSQLVSNIDQVREFYAANFGAGGLSDAALFASALDPGRSPLEFQREIEQAHIGGEAAMRGFDVATAETDRLQSLGLDQVAARRLFGQAQEQLPRLNELIGRFNDPDDEVTLEEFSDAVVISDPEQMRQFGRLFGRSTASFSPTGRVSMDRMGALAGLLQR